MARRLAKITITRRANADLRRIWRFIAQDNKTAASKFLFKIDQRISQLVDFPASGSLHDEIRENCRMLVVAGYRILYEYDDLQNAVEIVAIVEPYRDLEEVL